MSSRRTTKACLKPKNSRANARISRLPSKRIQKPQTSARTSARLRERSANTPCCLDLSQPSDQCENQAGPRQRKRQRDCEEEPPLPFEKSHPTKRARTSQSAVSYESQPLTAKSLESHTLLKGYVDRCSRLKGYLDTIETVGSEAGNSGRKRRNKRSVSRAGNWNGSAASTGEDPETASQVTHKSSFTAAHYRNSILKGANIRFQFRPAPDDIRNRTAAIVQLQASPERKEELSRIARKLHEDFSDVLDTAAREDDCIELFYQALSFMGYNESLALPRKADWQPSLKPCIRPTKVNLDHLYRSEDEAEESLERPSKRQQGDESYISPEISAEWLGPLPIPRSDVKTPRPDISIGLRDAAVVNALHSQGLTRVEAEDLLKALATPDVRNGGRPLLYSEPTQAALQIRFPFLPVEGKSYATGRTIYEAQNQAAVSGACSLKILHDLDDLVRKSDPACSKGQPIVFSICTEGSIHQLWVHYTTARDGDRVYHMAIIKTCDMALCNDVPGFLEAVDNVMRWGSGDHKKTIAKQLRIVWRPSS